MESWKHRYRAMRKGQITNLKIKQVSWNGDRDIEVENKAAEQLSHRLIFLKVYRRLLGQGSKSSGKKTNQGKNVSLYLKDK